MNFLTIAALYDIKPDSVLYKQIESGWNENNERKVKKTRVEEMSENLQCLETPHGFHSSLSLSIPFHYTPRTLPSPFPSFFTPTTYYQPLPTPFPLLSQENKQPNVNLTETYPLLDRPQYKSKNLIVGSSGASVPHLHTYKYTTRKVLALRGTDEKRDLSKGEKRNLVNAIRRENAQNVKGYLDISNIDQFVNTLQETPLMIAIRAQKISMVKLLYDLGANVNLAVNGGDSPLITAIQTSNYEIIKYLIELGANVNYCNGNLHTCLMFAIFRKCPKSIIELLVESGVDVDAVDGNGRNALSWANQYNYGEIIDYLNERGVEAS